MQRKTVPALRKLWRCCFVLIWIFYQFGAGIPGVGAEEGNIRATFEVFDTLVPGSLTTSEIKTEEAGTGTVTASDQEVHGRKSMIPPEFVLEPRNAYVVRNRPAMLTCRALRAKWIRFKCNNKWVDPKKHVTKEGMDQRASLPYLEASIPILRKEVEEYFGFDGFMCVCYASLSPDKTGSAVRSEKATVKVAYLRKHFYSTPGSEVRPVGGTVRLPCVPPDGDPKPDIFWLKNGREIDRLADSNVILANDGALIISAARLSDSGNYTCGARNLATRRLTQTASLTVFVNGGWSEWSEWSGDCDIDCKKLRSRRRHHDEIVSRRRPYLELPKLYRYRTCSNPEPKNGGQQCPGSSQETFDCPLSCPVDGGWSVWSDWSECTGECQQFRTRECGFPKPQNGGIPCRGSRLDSRNCTAQLCQRMPSHDRNQLGSFGLYAGFCALGFLCLFLLAVIVLICCLRKKRACFRTSKKSDDIYYAGNAGHLRTVLSIQPDLTQNALLVDENMLKTGRHATPLPAPPEFSSFSLHSGKSGSSYGQRAARENLRNMSVLANSKAALLEGSSSHGSHPPSIDSAEKNRCISRSSRNSEDHYATLYDAFEEQQNQRNSIISNAFPARIEVESLAFGKVDHKGCKICLPHCGVALTVPEGALERRQTEEMYIAVCRNVSDKPKLSDGETLLSPVIWCGPPGISFRKPVVLSFPHCAQLFPSNNWETKLMVNEGLPDDATDWQVAVELGKENINTLAYCQLDFDSVHVMTENLGRMALVGNTVPGQPRAVKKHKLAAFAPLYPSTSDYSLRVYCVEDTDAAVQGVMEEEEKMGGCLVADVKEFTCHEGGDLCFCLEDISPGWQVKPGANYQEIPAGHVWSGTSGLHCSFSLEMRESKKGVPNLSARIVVCQKGRSDALGGRQVIQVNRTESVEDWMPRSSSVAQTVVTSLGGSSRQSPNGSPNGGVQLFNSSHGPSFKLPLWVKRKIAAALDPPMETENDWRMLARKLSEDIYIQYFGFRSSPTEHILDLWEARESSQTAVMQLLQILKAMDRPDAASPLETYLAKQPMHL